ncbi:hypothetical protein [Micromonospora sp. NPDC047730]|uniref:hypothetical protein n=1 Tax=Micromonospora sp. NPDC047730 TaxID=3364253 RepID=UPI00371DBCAA
MPEQPAPVHRPGATAGRVAVAVVMAPAVIAGAMAYGIVGALVALAVAAAAVAHVQPNARRGRPR